MIDDVEAHAILKFLLEECWAAGFNYCDITYDRIQPWMDYPPDQPQPKVTLKQVADYSKLLDGVVEKFPRLKTGRIGAPAGTIAPNVLPQGSYKKP